MGRISAISSMSLSKKVSPQRTAIITGRGPSVKKEERKEV